jgi:RNA recognition motif-containing protein
LQPVKFKLNHASAKASGRGYTDREYSIWISDLTDEVTEDDLQKSFTTRYDSIKAVKSRSILRPLILCVLARLFVPTVVQEGTGKLYGFIRFTDQNDQREAVIHMNGFRGLGEKPIKVSVAVPKAGLSEANSLQEEAPQQDAAFSQYYEQYYSNTGGNYAAAYQGKAPQVLLSSQAPISTQEYELSEDEQEGDDEKNDAFFRGKNLYPSFPLFRPRHGRQCGRDEQRVYRPQSRGVGQGGEGQVDLRPRPRGGIRAKF